MTITSLIEGKVEVASIVMRLMQIEASEVFQNPCGFVPLKERHRVKAIRG